ncbi:hypothetical protein SAMN02745225_00269 [Ferrithrix thermotolerans DSM 19514]|uniref:CYTH domain-containing protein n=1 Tax=Ferrithrix thermotolerans DSM 19514 TaxID=1121881 RepID=A0A1M4SGD2_9ACTN|nr:CYTH domain-containing protein [Ferrithrix thermotolerans]SHE31260.1 hypothetical protein SAMN02745225_00269 [Ferrithrix thermotolerans DSM 19514]
MLEREYKLEFEGRHLKDDVDVATLAETVGVEVSRQGSKELVSLYFDTADYRLLRLGIGLRFRYYAPERNESSLGKGVWGVKTVPVSRSTLAVVRHEFEVEGVAAHPPSEFFEPITAVVPSVEELKKIAEIHNLRQWSRLFEDGREIVEVDKDRVEVMYPRQRSYLEVELECLTPKAASLCEKMASQLTAMGGKISARSKLEGALSLGAETPQVPNSLEDFATRSELKVALRFELWLHRNLESPVRQYLEQLLLASALGMIDCQAIRTDLYWVALGYLVLGRDSKEFSDSIKTIKGWILDTLLIGDSFHQVDNVSSLILSHGRDLPIDMESYWVYELTPLEYIRQLSDKFASGLHVKPLEIASELQLGAVAALKEYLLP